MHQNFKVANSEMKISGERVKGSFVKLGKQLYYKVANVDQMPPFFMSIVSHDEHWMFIGSNGALTAGRRNEENSLFPYYTDDKILASADKVGSKSIFQIKTDDGLKLWKPFSEDYKGLYTIERNLYKSHWVNEVIFEEINHDLGIVFSTSWKFSSKYGFVKKSSLKNKNNYPVDVNVLDGVQDIMPYGVSSQLQLSRSNLVNAYKKSELVESVGMGIFALSSLIVDRAEPSEALKATTAWFGGVNAENILLSSSQLAEFAKGLDVRTEKEVKGTSGSYFVNFSTILQADQSNDWFICLEISQRPSQVNNLIQKLVKSKESVIADLKEDLDIGTTEIQKIAGKADGLQLTADQACVSRHYANVLFNVMRGGIFEDDYRIDREDFLQYVQEINRPLFEQHIGFFEKITSDLDYHSLCQFAFKENSGDLIRICKEYLPLSFSRRHGDPSRPWNKFSIELKNADGSKRRAYAGNWRDIFQNWEALAVSYPQFLEGMIFKFLNASTIDGYNPYRIARNGVDWEVIEPDDPWSYIGYWGDHQLIYLLKLLELAKKHQVISLNQIASKDWFVFANVPYRIRSFDAIAKDPQDTVDFDEKLEKEIQVRFKAIGADGKLVLGNDQNILRSNFIEKILISYLTKLGNLVPDAGIWMNTQRPEWNDANNALVGNGTSMVTLYYMYRFTAFIENWISGGLEGKINLHEEVSEWLKGISGVLENFEINIDQGFNESSRYAFVKEVGVLSETYRNKAYAGFSNKHTSLSFLDFHHLLSLAKKYLVRSIQNNQRADGLFHAYNLIDIQHNRIQVDHLYEMLEGQVAILTSGYLSAEESLELLDQMKKSQLYREDQYSYLLYPNRDLKGFLDRSKVSSELIETSPILQKMIKDGDSRIIEADDQGGLYFNCDFNNVKGLRKALEEVKMDYAEASEEELLKVESLYEKVYNHKAFTGRSGTFFAFEGLGSIYWHMVSKLLHAVGEILSENPGIDEKVRGRLIDHYYEIRAGIGINKSPEVYGAIPTDPYSHTPAHRGAQQPGMTGQVKEDVLNRWAELGVKVYNGQIKFSPTFLSSHEWLSKPQDFQYFNLKGEPATLSVEVGCLAFTYCQVPVKYIKGERTQISVYLHQQKQAILIEGDTLSEELSRSIFQRAHDIHYIEVEIV